MTDDAHCQAELGEDPGLRQDGTACGSPADSSLTGSCLRRDEGTRGQPLWRIQGEAERRGWQMVEVGAGEDGLGCTVGRRG